MTCWLRFALLVCLALITESKKEFVGDQVLFIYPETEEQVKIIQGLENADFWNPKYANGITTDHKVDIHFPRESLDEVKGSLNANNIKFEVAIENVQALVDNQIKGRMARAESFLVHDYNVYHTLEEIQQWMVDITAEYPSLVKYDKLGVSTEGRDMHMLTISTNPNNPAILIDCTFHAREWISPAFCQCFTRNLLEGYGTDPLFTRHLDSLTFYIIPMINPDGYKYSWDENRMWRKTRSKYEENLCAGTDPNRNCDANYGGEGSSNNSCTETYRGPFVESEPEVKAFADFTRSHLSEIMVYVSVHSYSQLFVLPRSYTSVPSPTIDVLMKYAKQAADDIYSVYGTVYEYGQGSSSLYFVSGGSKDFAYDIGIPWTCTLELRDTGEYGFLLPEDQIESVCVETTAALRSLCDTAIELWLNSKLTV